MGKLLYSSGAIEIGFEDRALAHIHLVINAKLRRGEKFFFSWQDSPSVGSGRSSIWIEPSIPLYFKFTGTKPITINREWIEALNLTANSNSGLTFLSEPGVGPLVTPLPQARV
jgi:hypothetical protein